MRILLDECVHQRLGRNLAPHDVKTVPELGWRGTKNGELLRIAADQFDVFITSDKNIEYQHYLKTLPLPVIIISSIGNMWKDIEPLIPSIDVLLGLELNNEFYTVR
jgi:predicted nuclease of predicted toxin-antitoxin system